MALITNGKDIQNAVYGVLKKSVGFYLHISKTLCYTCRCNANRCGFRYTLKTE